MIRKVNVVTAVDAKAKFKLSLLCTYKYIFYYDIILIIDKMEGKKLAKLTPMMKQYMEIKEKHKDSILFFRLGDFYEMFFDDALTASKELEIALTARNCGQDEKAPMCGVPYHSSKSYIAKLVEKGYKVAICEQVEDPSEAKGIVKRDVVRIVTPGTITDSEILNEKENNYLCSVFIDDDGLGVSYVDISTGDMYTTEQKDNLSNNINTLIDELAKINPTEIIANNFLYEREELKQQIVNRFNVVLNHYYDWAFDLSTARKAIENQLSVISLDGFGLEDSNNSIKAAGALIEYLNETQKQSLEHLNTIVPYYIDRYMVLDINTRRNLELTETLRDKTKKGSLLWVLDKTSTAMGSRMLKKWIEEPLVDSDEIKNRLDPIESLVDNVVIMDDIKELLKEVYDIERLVGKISYGNCNGRDLVSLKNSISILPELKKLLIQEDLNKLSVLGSNMDTLEDIFKLIDDSIVDDPPVTLKEGGIIKGEYNKDLYELREASTNGKQWISELQQRERERTGVKSLKVGYNKVFGYYIELTKTNIDLAPDNYIRKQTLSNSERFITPELKEMESKILGAEEKMTTLEYQLFLEIRDEIKANIKRIQKTSKIVSTVDVLSSLATVAFKNNYIRPSINTEGIMNIENGRHPVVEIMLEDGQFVPNDTLLDNKDNRISIITGPNMAGKSTYMRQVALITLMAQIGSFIPADNANIPVVDRIFTRVGASDNLAQGQSTFMVEMSEVANILNNGTKNSLIILDEIGRGTSTYDGLSIAWSVVEYIANKTKIGAKTLFATHYHELTELEGKIDGVNNYRICVKEEGEDIIFLRKIAKGGTDRSYGIEVARLAGVPREVINRANNILKDLEDRDINKDNVKEINVNEELKESSDVKEVAFTSYNIEDNNIDKDSLQLDLFAVKEKELIDKIKSIDMMKVTPLDAINILYDLVSKTKEI
ncbi:DNA mismatch repair protein MutS [Dethiothermospora halolimnae]|uniref:DNA mismatch repair protein MutS n=1 Tax=Dethiothermospora halolimnae TaxID=3114390 RepID=UPI003CCC3CF8